MIICILTNYTKSVTLGVLINLNIDRCRKELISLKLEKEPELMDFESACKLKLVAEC